MDPNLDSPHWRLRALRCALSSAPKTVWEPDLVFDYEGQLLSHSTMRERFSYLAHDARDELLSAPGVWATTGKWPRLPKTGKFFLRLAIQEALACIERDGMRDSSQGTFRGPPWSEDAAGWLGRATTGVWYAALAQDWIEDQAREHFDSQEHMERMWRPYE
jgi:hypothetical protein